MKLTEDGGKCVSTLLMELLSKVLYDFNLTCDITLGKSNGQYGDILNAQTQLNESIATAKECYRCEGWSCFTYDRRRSGSFFCSCIFLMTRSVQFSKSSFYMTENPSNELHDTLILFKFSNLRDPGFVVCFFISERSFLKLR